VYKLTQVTTALRLFKTNMNDDAASTADAPGPTLTRCQVRPRLASQLSTAGSNNIAQDEAIQKGCGHGNFNEHHILVRDGGEACGLGAKHGCEHGLWNSGKACSQCCNRADSLHITWRDRVLTT